MTFIGTGENLLAIITFFASSVGKILLATDEIQVMDAPISVLDIFISIILLEMLFWYIIRIITSKNTENTNKESENNTENSNNEDTDNE